MVVDGKINKGSAEKVLNIIWETGDDAQAIVEREGLAQVSDTDAIGAIVDQVLADNDDTVQGFLSGKEKLFGALMGQCMKALRGKGNPQVVRQLLQEKLAAMKG